MNKILLFLGVFLALNGTSRLSAQGNQTGAVKANDLQRQINELKEGQQKVLVELAEIKKLLQQNVERSGGKTIPTEANPSLSTLNVHGEPFRGPKTARVVVMEFSDFECSFCGKYAREVYPQLSKEFIETGKVKYYFRDLPEFGKTNSVLKARGAQGPPTFIGVFTAHSIIPGIDVRV
jgi:protein-disulfide isomerase